MRWYKRNTGKHMSFTHTAVSVQFYRNEQLLSVGKCKRSGRKYKSLLSSSFKGWCWRAVRNNRACFFVTILQKFIFCDLTDIGSGCC